MLHHQAECGIGGTRPVARLGQRRDDQPPVHLAAMVHPRGILLPDIAALGEADAVQLARIAFQPQRLGRAELAHPLGHAQPQAMRGPALRHGGVRPGGGEPAPAQRRQSGVGHALAAIGRPVHLEVGRRDRDRAAQTIEGQPLRQRLGLRGLRIDQHIVAVRPEEEVEQRLALRTEQRGPARRIGRERRAVVGHQPLEEAAHIIARDAQHGAIGEHSRTSLVHVAKVGGRRARRKPRHAP
ncbi:hypothetical protein QE452_003572 [Sphingomonas sp. SORGH_AS438]|nr:hypothetical protein [Sphingomonas sp. SORGH_AS_0438]